MVKKHHAMLNSGVLPEKDRKCLAVTNMQERLNEEIRRWERVIRIFLNEASVIRLIGAILAEKHEVWSENIWICRSSSG